MNKPLLVISCPIDTFSGYGSRARDIVKALLKENKYNVRIISQRWGNTPMGFLKEEHNYIKECIITDQLTQQPDIWIQITIPNEFQPIGKYNIGITAGIETTICAPEWIEGINRMNLTLVSSEHARNVFINTKIEKIDQNKKVIETIQVSKPIEILFEGVDLDIYKKIDKLSSDLSNILNDIQEDFCFLFVGHWLQGTLGQDRKDVGMLVKTFLETFRNKKYKPALILKTGSATYSIMDRDETLKKIEEIQRSVEGDLPKIYLIHGELDEFEINELYNHPKIKVSITFSKGEGFGRPLLEASISGKPIIFPEYSGPLDFLDKEMCIPLSGEITQIHPSAVVDKMLIKESGWFTVNYKKASSIMEDVYKNYKKYQEGAKRQAYRSKKLFSLEEMGNKLIKILDEKVPKYVPLVIPKINLPTLKKIE